MLPSALDAQFGTPYPRSAGFDTDSGYHAILGRTAYARFMARPCYVYLKLKMPGLRGVITVTSNRQRAEECFQKGSKIADEQMAAIEMEEYK